MLIEDKVADRIRENDCYIAALSSVAVLAGMIFEVTKTNGLGVFHPARTHPLQWRYGWLWCLVL